MRTQLLHLVHIRRHRANFARRGQLHKLRANAELERTVCVLERRQRVAAHGQALASQRDHVAVHRHRVEIHARAADEVADEGVVRPLEQRFRPALLHHLAFGHDDDLIGKGQRFHLIVRHVDQRELQLLVNLLELAAQLPLQVRINDGERLIEQDGRHVLAHQAAAQRDLLLGIRRQARGAALECVLQLKDLGDFLHALLHFGFRRLAIAQREGEVVEHGHRVVDDRELEHLGDVALARAGVRHVLAVKQHLAFRRYQ